MAGIFQPTLQTQVQAEMAVEDRSTASAIGAITDITSSFFKSQQASRPSGPTYKQAKLEKFSSQLSTLQQLSESGDVAPSRIQADLRLAAQGVSALEVPEALRLQYESISGTPFDAFSYDDPEEFNKNQLLKSDFAQGIRPSVITSIEAEGGVATPEAVDAAVMAEVEERNLLQNQIDIERQKRIVGQDFEPTPVLKGIRADYQVLLNSVKAAQADQIVEQSEYRSLQTSVSNLIVNKYVGFETNPEVNGVIKQMNGLLDDIGKGVSTTPLEVMADNIQVALSSKGFSQIEIGIARAMLLKDPQNFRVNFGTDEKGKTVADAIVELLKDGGTTKPLVDIFDTGKAPERSVVAGENPSKMDIPSVQENPEAYQQVVDKLSQSGATTDPNRLLGNTEARNSWINSMNIVGNAVASQSDEFILGEKLLSMFASNGVVKNLEAVYSTDPANAAQTNDVLQGGLAAERIRQVNELNSRLNAGVGEGQLILASPDGTLQLNSNIIDRNAASLAGGEAGWNEMKGKIAAAGGLEAFLKLPKTTTRGPNLDAAIMVGGTPYFLSDMFRIEFGTVAKMANNIKMIDTKLNNLEGLATKYQSETDLLRGTGTTSDINPSMITGFNIVADDGAFLGAVETTSQNLGINSADLLTAISFETVGTFSPSIKNPQEGSTATGLIQFLESTAKGLGTTTVELAQMDRTQQMEYVEKYLRPFKGRMKNLGDVYMAIHWPGGVGKDDNYVMYREGSNNYRLNKVLDVNGDGTVTRGESLQRVRQSSGSGGQGGQVNPDERITTSELPAGTAEAAPVVQTTAPTTSLRPQARPEVAPEAVEVDQTTTEGGSFGGQGLVRVIDSPTYSPELQRLLQALRVDPEQTFNVADLDELDAAQADGRLKAGDKVVVGQGAEAFVVELE